MHTNGIDAQEVSFVRVCEFVRVCADAATDEIREKLREV